MFRPESLAPFFTGTTTWIGLAGVALFVFLLLFRTVAVTLVVNMRVPRSKAANIVYVFMLLTAIITLATLSFAFLEAAARRDFEEKRNVAYQSALRVQQENIRRCIATDESSNKFTQEFSSVGSARCPGGGCLFQSGSCNRRQTAVSYGAPGEYFIDRYDLIPGDMNSGNVGEVSVSARDKAGRATAVQAVLWCDPPDRPGAPGGWANATIRGTIRLGNEAARRDGIAVSCRAKFPEPSPP